MIAQDLKSSNSVQLDHEDVGLLQSLAALHFMFGRIRRAIDLIHLASWILPADAENLRLSAILHFSLGETEEALNAVREYQIVCGALPEELALIVLRSGN